MMKKIVCFVLGLLLIMPFVSAAVTEITVKAPMNYKVSLMILQPTDVYGLIESVQTKVGTDGIAQVNYSSTLDEIKLGVLVKFAGETLSYDTYGPFSTGEPVYIDSITGEVKDSVPVTETPTDIINESLEQNNSEELLMNETEGSNSPFLTGKFVSTLKENKTIIFYCIGGVFLVGIIIFLVVHKMKIPKGDIKVKKLSDIQKEKEDSGDEDKRIKELQNQIYAAQKRINEIKNKDKIEEVRKKLEKDKEELEKLEKGED